MMEDGGGMFGSIVAGSTKGMRIDGLFSSSAAPTAPHPHNRIKLKLIARISVAEERRLWCFDRKHIEIIFITRPLNERPNVRFRKQ
jgi:hypothetical protein